MRLVSRALTLGVDVRDGPIPELRRFSGEGAEDGGLEGVSRMALMRAEPTQNYKLGSLSTRVNPGGFQIEPFTSIDPPTRTSV